MTPERMAGLVARWVRFYTRDLPAPVARRRIAELDADVDDQIAHGRTAGIGDRRIAFELASRLVRGLAADAAWRGRHARLAAGHSTPGESMKTSTTLSRSTLRVAVGVAIVLSLPFVAMLVTDEVAWSLADFVLAAVLLATIGAALELAVRRAGNLFVAFGIGILGAAAAVLGEVDDAPGLVLLGLLLLAGACAIGVRATRATG